MSTYQSPYTSLTRSVATESLADLLGKVSETALDSVLEAGILRDIPVIGVITGMMKAGRDMRDSLFLRKVAIFLKEMSQTSAEDCAKFVAQFDSDEKQHEFGQAILMLLDRSEDMNKPRLIAKIITAHIQEHIDAAKTMRLCAIVNRCFTQDLSILENFSEGTQGENSAIAESLFSVGLLSHGGIDGGTWEGRDGGVIFVMNEYGRLLTKYALCPG
jgi:hypothetical protein